MNRRKETALSCAALLIAILVGALLFQPGEPEHEGRPLSHWLADLGMPNAQKRGEAEAAVKAMGADIVPHLIRRLDERDSSLGRRFSRLASKAPFVESKPPVYEVHFQAAWACWLLDDKAHAAAPALVALLDQPNASFPVPQLVAKYLGEEAVQPLLDALPHATFSTKTSIINALGSLRRAARPALPELLKLTTTRDRSLQQCAEDAILQIADEPAKLMPLLIRRLKGRPGRRRIDAIHRVGQIGAHAKDAVPALLKIHDSDNSDEKQMALASIRLINPSRTPAQPATIGPLQSELQRRRELLR